MKRVWGHVLAGLTVTAAIALAGGVPACAHDDSTIFVNEVLAPQFVTPGMECVYTADPTQPHISGGTLDVGFAGEYGAAILLGNQTIPRGNPSQPQTETSYVTVEGAVVTIDDVAGNQLSSYTTRVAVTIPPSSGTTPGYSVTGVTLVDSATVNKLAVQTSGPQQVISNVRFFGHTLGGDSVESNTFAFPIDLCYGCLVAYSAADISPRFKSPNCVGNGSGSGTTTTSVPCTPGQDAFIDCASCQGFPVCRRNNDQPIADAGTD